MKHDWNEYFNNGTFILLESFDMNDPVWNLVEFLYEDKPTEKMWQDCRKFVVLNKFKDVQKFALDHQEYEAWLLVLKQVEDIVNKKPLKEQPPIVKYWHYRYINSFRKLPYVEYNYTDYFLKAYKIAKKGSIPKKSNGIQLTPQQEKNLEIFFSILARHKTVVKSGSKYKLLENVTKTFYIQLVDKASKIIFGGDRNQYDAFRKYLPIEIKDERQIALRIPQEHNKNESKVNKIIKEVEDAIIVSNKNSHN